MKIKFLSIMMAVAVALAFTSCEDKSSSSKSSSEKSESSSEKSESSDDEVSFSIDPTGNPKKDAKACEEMLEKYNEIMLAMSEADLKVIEYYAKKGDYEGYEQFNTEVQSLAQKIQNKFSKKSEKLASQREKAMNKLKKNRPSETEEEIFLTEEEEIIEVPSTPSIDEYDY